MVPKWDKKVNHSRKIDHIMAQDCFRFRGLMKKLQISDSLAYLNLREKGCPHESAIAFASKSCCKYDVTREFDGPPNFRCLKIVKDPFKVSQGVAFLLSMESLMFG